MDRITLLEKRIAQLEQALMRERVSVQNNSLLTITPSGSGKVININAKKLGGAEGDPNGTRTDLAHDHATSTVDDWGLGDEGGFNLWVIVDFGYDESQHKFYFITRTLSCDANGIPIAVSQRSSKVYVYTTTGCS